MRVRPWHLVVLAAALPRLGILLHERGSILTSFTEKSDDIAQTFVHSGTFGFIPGEPTAWTQPLYAFFLDRCPCHGHVHHYPAVYKTWEGKWPPAYAGPDDKAVIYTDEEPLMP